jgi:hypothetical protein
MQPPKLNPALPAETSLDGAAEPREDTSLRNEGAGVLPAPNDGFLPEEALPEEKLLNGAAEPREEPDLSPKEAEWRPAANDGLLLKEGAPPFALQKGETSKPTERSSRFANKKIKRRGQISSKTTTAA